LPESARNSLTQICSIFIVVETRKAARLAVRREPVNDKVGTVNVISHGEFNCDPRHVESALWERDCMFHAFSILRTSGVCE
jgi:hypothetical protein